jgi:hypothetical protein
MPEYIHAEPSRHGPSRAEAPEPNRAEWADTKTDRARRRFVDPVIQSRKARDDAMQSRKKRRRSILTTKISSGGRCSWRRKAAAPEKTVAAALAAGSGVGSTQWREKANQADESTTRKTEGKNDPRQWTWEEEAWVVQVQRQERRLGEERKLNPNFGSVYHVINNTCIHLSAKDPYIFMYRKGRIYKEPHREIQ